MLNLDLIDALYAELPKSKQQELISLLFKRSKQTMNYFHRTKDISLSKFETLADYFNLSLDSLRVGSSIRQINPIKDSLANSSKTCTELANVNYTLQKENESLRERINDLLARIADKDALINIQNKMLDNQNKD